VDSFVLCPACNTKNRIPEEKVGEKAKCGSCGNELPEVKAGSGGAPPLVLRCAACGGKNRVPVEKLKQGAKCGKCHIPLQTDDVMTAWAVPVTDANFESKVLNSPLPVLLEFVSSACGACTKSRPIINRLAAEWKGRTRVCRTDVMANPATANRYQVMSTPSVLIFDRGRHLDTVVGVAPREMFLQKMAPYLE
jgi:thioredoxin 2